MQTSADAEKTMNMPLVSILVVSYRNYGGLYETIESVCQQTYPNIELIISDDGSAGFTDELPKLETFTAEHNSGNIVSVIFNSIPQNVGTVKNLNQALELSNGAYIKTLAAEDTFSHANVLSNYVSFAEETGYKVVFGKIRGITPAGKYVTKLPSCESNYGLLKSYSVEDTLNRLFAANFLPGVGEFISASVFQQYGAFPEEVRLIEDYPYWLKLSLAGVRFGYIDEFMVDYRLSGVSSSGIYSEAFMNDLFAIYDKYIFPNDKRYGAFQPIYNGLKRAGLNYYMGRSRTADASKFKRAGLALRYLPFYFYDKARQASSS